MIRSSRSRCDSPTTFDGTQISLHLVARYAAGAGNDDVQFDPHDPPIDLAVTSLADALIRVRELPAQYDPRDDIDFEHNMARVTYQTKGNAVRDTTSEKDYWVVQMVGAYEAEQDWDHDGEGTGLLGIDTGGTEDEPLFIFLETIRDIAANVPGTVTRSTYEQRITLHEMLHQFLGPHSPDSDPTANPSADEGIMDYGVCQFGTAQQCELTPRQLLKIQTFKDYPGD